MSDSSGDELERTGVVTEIEPTGAFYTRDEENSALLSEPDDHKLQDSIRRDPKYYSVVMEIETAIAKGILPTLIEQGSSGSYFCKNEGRDIVGVFKPKNEEPYGPQNPKWGKWFQRNFCRCCYGRACLVSNQGYLSEAGASIVDKSLGLNVVPPTKVIRLVSKSFHYSKFVRARANAVRKASERFPDTIGKHLKQGLPPKVGSMQIFVKGYKDATQVLKRLDISKLHAETRRKFQLQFESLVVLDYICRNTDRGNDNWLIKYDPPDENGQGEDILVAAIDNGLAFPIKHPDNWRTYPYHWYSLPMAKEKFSQDTIDKILPLIENDDFVEELCDQLYVLFSQDKHFKKKLYEDQMGVMRGQILNLKKALRDGLTIQELVRLPRAKLMIQKPDQETEATSALGRARNQIRRYRQIIVKRMPVFSCC